MNNSHSRRFEIDVTVESKAALERLPDALDQLYEDLGERFRSVAVMDELVNAIMVARLVESGNWDPEPREGSTANAWETEREKSRIAETVQSWVEGLHSSLPDDEVCSLFPTLRVKLVVELGAPG